MCEIGRDPALDLDQRFDGQKTVVADVDMAADGKEARAYRQVAIPHRPINYRLTVKMRLQFAP